MTVKKMAASAAMLVVMLAAFPAGSRLGVPIDQAVVKVISVVSNPDYGQPWQTGPQSLQSGSGVVVSGGRVLTNAHVVANQTFVQVQRQGDPTKYPARVLVAGHECDLALLEVDDPAFIKGVSPLKIGKMPAVRDKVAAYGFPIGGDKLSITEGVVSRIEMGQYSHCWKSLPLIQIDAAINPGNSGGPVIENGRIVGIAFQGIGQADNVGYMIPPPVIRHFLDDVADGDYDGFPSLGISYQSLENPQARESLGMAPGRTGVLVTRVEYDSSAWRVLEPGDVILAVEGLGVANDGTVPFTGGERILFSWFLVDKFPGDEAKVDILRNGKAQSISLRLKTFQPVVSTCEFDRMPSYFMFGGLVFSPLTLNYLQTWDVDRWWFVSPVELRYHVLNDVVTPERRQVVILQYVLADEVNVGYHDVENEIVTRVNGENIKDLADLGNKIESVQSDFIRIETESGHRLVLSARLARESNPRIMERYRIPADRSEDLARQGSP